MQPRLKRHTFADSPPAEGRSAKLTSMSRRSPPWVVRVTATALVFVLLVGIAAIALLGRYQPGGEDRHRAAVLAQERVLLARPAGFTRLGKVQSRPGHDDLLGPSLTEDGVVDVVSVSPLTATATLLRLAQADGWVTHDEICDFALDFASFQADKQEEGFIASLTAGYYAPHRAYVNLTAPHRGDAADTRFVRPGSTPGCLDELGGVTAIGRTTVLADTDPSAAELVAYDGKSGRVRWRTNCAVQQPAEPDDGVFAGAGVLVTGCGRDTAAVAARSGRVLWRKESAIPGVTPYALDAADRLALVANFYDAAAAVDPSTGRPRWIKSRQFASDFVGWLPHAPPREVLARINRSDVVHNPSIIAALDAATGRQRWAVETQGQDAPVVVTPAAVIVSVPRGLRAVDPSTGTTLWALPEGENYSTSMLAVAGAVTMSIPSYGHSAVAVATATGLLQWQRPLSGEVIEIAGDDSGFIIRTTDGVESVDLAGGLRARIPAAPAENVLLTSTGVAAVEGSKLSWYALDGRRRWTYQLSGPALLTAADPPSAGVAVVEQGGRVADLDMATGAVRWTARGLDAANPPTIVDGLVLVRELKPA